MFNYQVTREFLAWQLKIFRKYVFWVCFVLFSRIGNIHISKYSPSKFEFQLCFFLLHLNFANIFNWKKQMLIYKLKEIIMLVKVEYMWMLYKVWYCLKCCSFEFLQMKYANIPRDFGQLIFHFLILALLSIRKSFCLSTQNMHTHNKR